MEEASDVVEPAAARHPRPRQQDKFRRRQWRSRGRGWRAAAGSTTSDASSTRPSSWARSSHAHVAHCPRQQRIVHVSSGTLFWKKESSDSYLDTLKSSDFYMRKEKLRLVSGQFEKFGLISDKKKIRTHI